MGQFVLLGVMFAAFYLLLILPRQREEKKTRTMQSSLAEGDEIYLSSGIHGFVAELEDHIAWVTIAPDVDLKISRSAIAGKITPSVDEPEEA